MQKMKSFIKIFINIIIVFFLISCGNNTDNNKYSTNSKEESVSISGTYSGTDNVGMQSTISLYSNGSMIVNSSIGDGSPSYGRWSGSAGNLSLYVNDSYGGESFLGSAKVTTNGLSVNGGKFYGRK